MKLKTTDMLPIEFEGMNFTFSKPKGWTDEQCAPLHVYKGDLVDENGNKSTGIISCWQFSKEDLEEIQKTGRIYLSISGSGMPPVSLFTENPFPSTNPANP